jgi:hypothetical protein
MGIQRNKVVKSISPKSLFDDMSNVISSASTFNQGDFLVLTGNVLLPVASNEPGTNFCGVSRATVVAGLPVAPIQGTDVDASVQPVPLAGPEYGSTFKVVLKTGDAINPGDKVYIDGASGTRNVTTTAGASKAIGIYQGPAIASASAGQEIEVLIGAVYPNADCHF